MSSPLASIETPKSQFNNFIERQKDVSRRLSVNIRSNYALRKSKIGKDWRSWARNSHCPGLPQLMNGKRSIKSILTWIVSIGFAGSILAFYLWQRVEDYRKYQTSTNINSVGTPSKSLPFIRLGKMCMVMFMFIWSWLFICSLEKWKWTSMNKEFKNWRWKRLKI